MVARQVTATPEIPAIAPIPPIAPITPVGGIGGVAPLPAIPRVFGIPPPGLLAFKTGDLPASVRSALERGTPNWPKAVDEAIAQGIKDVDQLADLIFYMHHPERVRPDGVGAPVEPTELGAAKLRTERRYHAIVARRRLDRLFVPPVFAPANASRAYEQYVAAPTTGRMSLMINGRTRPSPTAAAVDRGDAFASMRATLETLRAGDSVYLVTWEFKPFDVPLDVGAARSWGDLFLDLARRGVRIRVIVSVHPVDVFMSDLVKLDGKIRDLPANRVDNFKYLGSPHPATVLGNRVGDHHQKFMVVERGSTTVAYCGGLDITAGRPPNGWSDAFVWHDIHAKLEGKIVKDLEREFVERWNRERDAAKVAEIGPWKAKDIVGVWKKGFETLAARRESKQDGLAASNPHRVQLHRTVSTAGVLVPVTQRDDVWQGYFDLIGRAKRFLFLENQYFHEPVLAGALVTQLQAEPNLVVIVVVATGSDDPGNDFVRHMYALRFEFFARLLLSDLSLAKRIGVYTMFYTSGIVHSKLILADDEVLSVGSANASQRSFFLDTEANVMLEHPDTVRDFRVELWAHDLGKPEAEVAKWKPQEFLARWNAVADFNRRRHAQPKTMVGEGIDHYRPLAESDPKSILRHMKKIPALTGFDIF